MIICNFSGNLFIDLPKIWELPVALSFELDHLWNVFAAQKFLL
jgi:hypothetical protein